MAKRSAYRDFFAELKKHWRDVLPEVKPLAEERGSIPVASTFYVGFVQRLEMHVYLYFQHSAKRPGEFTINVVLSKDEHAPRHWGFAEDPEAGQEFGQGPYRIGEFIGAQRGDKWWRLRQDKRHEEWCRQSGIPIINEDWWCPANYDDYDDVIRTAVEDVTRDVRLTLSRFGILEL